MNRPGFRGDSVYWVSAYSFGRLVPASTVASDSAGGTSPRYPWRRCVLSQFTQVRVASPASSTVFHGPFGLAP